MKVSFIDWLQGLFNLGRKEQRNKPVLEKGPSSWCNQACAAQVSEQGGGVRGRHTGDGEVHIVFELCT